MAQTHTVGTHKTRIETVTRVIYHNTAVVEFTNRQIILNTGGWKTNTTKARMNQASNQFDLGFQVFQKNHEWFVTFKGKTLHFPLTTSKIFGKLVLTR